MSDLISKKELYRKLGEAYNKGYLSWGANEVIKDIIGECDSVENKGDLISRQAIIDAIQKLNIPEDMCVFEIISHIEVAIATLPSVQPEPISEEYAKAVRNWLVNYQVKCAELQGRYTPYEVLGWIVSDWRKENEIW